MVKLRCFNLLLREDKDFIMGCANTELSKSSLPPLAQQPKLMISFANTRWFHGFGLCGCMGQALWEHTPHPSTADKHSQRNGALCTFIS